MPPSLLASFAGITHSKSARCMFVISVSLPVLFRAGTVRLWVKWAGAGTDCGNRAGCDERRHRTTPTCCCRHGCCHPFLISISCLCKHWSPPHLHEQCSCQSCRHLLHYFTHNSNEPLTISKFAFNFEAFGNSCELCIFNNLETM